MRTPDFRYPLGTAFLFIAGLSAPQLPAPEAAVEELLAADRAFAGAAATTDAASGITAMFAEDVVMPVPGGRFAAGKAEARAAFEAGPDPAGTTADWRPVRGGISADGTQGFTFGYMKLTRPDRTVIPAKYLAYWIKGPSGWRVAVYKRGRLPVDAVVPGGTMPSALPPRMVAPSTESAALERFRQSLDQAERAFSDEAQKIGLGPAFAKYGSEDAVNMGGPSSPGFVVGSVAIGKAVSTGEPATGGSTVHWAPDRVIVAGSGDLGVTIGWIRRNAEPNEKGFPFFTIWRRNTPGDPWRYVAE